MSLLIIFDEVLHSDKKQEYRVFLKNGFLTTRSVLLLISFILFVCQVVLYLKLRHCLHFSIPHTRGLKKL
jgi:hypothetical protein